MGYTNREEQRAYQREWLRRRREAWLKENGPCAKCGGKDFLEVHHNDPAEKISHNVWSWSQARRERELSKCTVLCYDCHIKITAVFNSRPMVHGSRSTYRRGCRCGPCKEAQSVYNAEWRRKSNCTHSSMVERLTVNEVVQGSSPCEYALGS